LARLKLNVDFIDIGKQYSLLVENGVLNYVNKFVHAPDATLTLTKDTLDSIPLKQITMDQAIESGAIKIDGNKEAFTDFLGLLDTYLFLVQVPQPPSRWVTLAVLREVRFWHFSDIPPALTNVRYRG
jgi:alkyl sulfatase BDS1-like metallo-beta-lactamase superfamily hydrolase